MTRPRMEKMMTRLAVDEVLAGGGSSSGGSNGHGT